jgi:predicted Rdx family selenoprotein
VLKEQLDVSPELVRGSGGIFKVEVDGGVVAQKTRDGFPDEQEIVDAVARALDRAGG